MLSNRKIILMIVLLAMVSLTAYIVVVIIPARLAEKSYNAAKQIGKDISKAFQFTPEIEVNNIIVLQQQTAVLELATIKQQFQHQYAWTNTWAGSTKKITISGIFESKAGFDLNRRFSISLDDKKAVVILPEPQVLSVELISDVKFNDEHGVWNWVNGQDRANAINAFQRDARKFAAQADFVQQAKVNMERQLGRILQQHQKEMEIKFVNEPVRKTTEER
jgi:hypothetical protein